jgi:hypothetical protein
MSFEDDMLVLAAELGRVASELERARGDVVNADAAREIASIIRGHLVDLRRPLDRAETLRKRHVLMGLAQEAGILLARSSGDNGPPARSQVMPSAGRTAAQASPPKQAPAAPTAYVLLDADGDRARQATRCLGDQGELFVARTFAEAVTLLRAVRPGVVIVESATAGSACERFLEETATIAPQALRVVLASRTDELPDLLLKVGAVHLVLDPRSLPTTFAQIVAAAAKTRPRPA